MASPDKDMVKYEIRRMQLRRRRRLVGGFAGVVVLVAALTLMLPATSMTREAATPEAGFFGVGGQQVQAGGVDTNPMRIFEAELAGKDGVTTLLVTAEVPEGALPKDVEMRVATVTDSQIVSVAKDEAQASADIDASKSKVLAADISFVDAMGNELEPDGDVLVKISAPDVAEISNQESFAVVHVADDLRAQTLSSDEVTLDSSNEEVVFEASEFSVYAVVYTVDFHWEVDGNSYEFNIPGGGFMSFQKLMELIGVGGVPATEGEQAADDQPIAVPAAMPASLDDVQVSDRTKAFVADVQNVAFSDPDLVWAGKATQRTTVGALKEEHGLTAEYSAELTEEQIAGIDAQPVEAGDWALISMRPFSSEELLTVTMKDGEVFTIRVTDALQVNPDELVGKEIVIYDKTEKRALTSKWEKNEYRTQFESIEYGGEGTNTPDNAHWTVEKNGSNYYLRSHDGKYLKIDQNNVYLVGSLQEATPLAIQKGENPDYNICAKNDKESVLTYSENKTYPGFFSAPGGTVGTGKTRTWHGIDYATTVPDNVGDWLLYLDDDFSEITIHVGETITLRPYDKWTWKESNVQAAHWNIGGVSDWAISGNDANGSKKYSWTDGAFAWTRYVKYDDQLDTRYWSVQGRATATGDYTLTNSKNGRTITVHVVDGNPVNKPSTISGSAGIKVNLFDYDKNYLLDPSDNSNLANNTNNKGDSINKEAGSSNFYFLSSGGGTSATDTWNNYTKDARNPGIVKNELDANGYPVLNNSSSKSLQYLFDTSEASQHWHGGNNNDAMIAYPNVEGMFQKDSAGYYYYNSNVNYFYYDPGNSYLYEHTYTQTSGKEKGSLVNDKPIGFFPFHDYDSTSNLYVNQNTNLNHHVGLSMDIDFILPTGKRDENGKEYVFDFSGDDDLWVFLEWTDDQGKKHSKLMLDLGGIHQPITGSINFTKDDTIKANTPYRLKVFYLERGGCDSNCSIRFNLPVVKELSLEKRLTGLTDSDRQNYRGEEFTYEVFVNNELYNGSDTIRTNAAGKIVERGFEIVDGQVKIKDGETVTITGLARNDTFYAAEEKSLNMDQFETPHAERYYQAAEDGAQKEEEIVLTESETQGAPSQVKDWKTPTYSLQDTEKVTFTNALKEKDLEVNKKWEGGGTHPDQVEFTVSASVEGDDGSLQPCTVAVLKESDGVTDKKFTLAEGNGWRTTVEHLPVQNPDGKLIVYDIKEVHVDGYVSSSKDLTAQNYNYCNVDAVKLWPDDQHADEVITVKLKNAAGQYYAGTDAQGNAVFDGDGQTFDLAKNNNYTHRFARLPYADTYSLEQVGDQNGNTTGLVTYVRNIIQYQVTNTPTNQQVDPSSQENPEIHKRIDALRDGVTNLDSPHEGEDLTDLYRLYLDYKVNSLQSANGVDLLFVIDHSGSMNNDDYSGNQFRAPAVKAALNGEDGLVAEFLKMNEHNRWAAVEFSGPSGFNYRQFSLLPPFYKDTEFRSPNAGKTDSGVIAGWNKQAAKIELENLGATMLTDYTAGLWRAEQLLFDQETISNGKKKVVVFISDGIPTLYIDCNGTLDGADQKDGSAYYPDPEGCPDQTLRQVENFRNDIVGKSNASGEKAFVFGENIEFYTVGFGDSMKTEYGSALLKNMLKVLYDDEDHEGNFMTINDTPNSRWQEGYGDITASSRSLKEDLRTIMGMNETFSNIVIQDDLSKYVDLFATQDESDPLKSAKAKVTMTDPADPTKVVVLWDNGNIPNDEMAQFANASGERVPIISRLDYDASTKTVKAVFNPEYEAVAGATYTLSFDVKATDEAYTTYANSGYDKHVEGDNSGQVIKGDPDTDYKGGNPSNSTSSDKEGFQSNDSAKAIYKHNGNDEEKEYPHPVIQVFNASVQLLKIDQSGNPLEGAVFALYKDAYDASKTSQAQSANAANLVKEGLRSTLKGDQPNQVAEISVEKLRPGTYYLVETETPAGYNSIEPIKIDVSVNTVVQDGATSDTVNVVATQSGEALTGFLEKPEGDNGEWVLKVQNTAGYELPSTGGPGALPFALVGGSLAILGVTLLCRRMGQRS